MEQPKKKPYDFVSPELIEKAEGIINHNAKYCNLKKEYEKGSFTTQLHQADAVKGRNG